VHSETTTKAPTNNCHWFLVPENKETGKIFMKFGIKIIELYMYKNFTTATIKRKQTELNCCNDSCSKNSRLH